MPRKLETEVREIRAELLELGIDVDKTIEFSQAAQSIKYSVDTGHDSYSHSLKETFRRKTRVLVSILLGAFIGALLVVSLLLLGVVSQEPALFVARSALIMLTLLTVFSLLILLHHLWAQILADHQHRSELEEQNDALRIVLKALC